MTCYDELNVMKSNMKEQNLLPRFFSEPNCQGDMMSGCLGVYHIPFGIKSMIVPLTTKLTLIDSGHRWTSTFDHAIHGEFVDNTEEIIEQWSDGLPGEVSVRTYYQSWAEADKVDIQQEEYSYYELMKRQCEETGEHVWCQHLQMSTIDENSNTGSSWVIWIVFLLFLIFIVWYVQEKKKWPQPRRLNSKKDT
jgi:hypothetical protein